jgi:hypothetical protein
MCPGGKRFGRLTTANYGTYGLSAGSLFFIFPDEPTFYYPDPHWQQHFIVFNGPDAEQLCQVGYFTKETMLVNDAAAVFMEVFHPLVKLMGDESLGAVLERKYLIERLVLNVYIEPTGSRGEQRRSN